MEWQIFALLQMALITVGVALAFGLHNRKLASQNTQLRAHLEQKQAALESPAPTDPKEALRAAIASTDAETPFQPLFAALAENVLSPAEDFSERLAQLLTELELGTPGDGVDSQALQARIAELEAELAAAQNDPIDPDDVQSEELKTLLQQFTHDSREMMACIQTLEEENAALKTELEALKGPEEEMENTTSGDESDSEPSPDQSTTEEPEAVDVDQLMEAQDSSVEDSVAAEDADTSPPAGPDAKADVVDEERLAAPPQRTEAETSPAEKNEAKDDVA